MAFGRAIARGVRSRGKELMRQRGAAAGGPGVTGRPTRQRTPVAGRTGASAALSRTRQLAQQRGTTAGRPSPATAATGRQKMAETRARTKRPSAVGAGLRAAGARRGTTARRGTAAGIASRLRRLR